MILLLIAGIVWDGSNGFNGEFSKPVYFVVYVSVVLAIQLHGCEPLWIVVAECPKFLVVVLIVEREIYLALLQNLEALVRLVAGVSAVEVVCSIDYSEEGRVGLWDEVWVQVFELLYEVFIKLILL